MTLRQAERLLRYLDLQRRYDAETMKGEFQTSTTGRSVLREEVEEAKAEFLIECGAAEHGLGAAARELRHQRRVDSKPATR